MQSRRERTLLAVFLAAVFIAAATLGWSRFSKHLMAQKADLEQKEAQLKEADRWLGKKEIWTAKGGWIAAHHPPIYEGPQTDSAFVRNIQESLAKRNVEILEQRIQESRIGAKLVEVQIDVLVSASLENLVRWLYENQTPDSFRGITHIKLKSDADNSKIRAEISLVQFYGKPGL